MGVKDGGREEGGNDHLLRFDPLVTDAFHRYRQKVFQKNNNSSILLFRLENRSETAILYNDRAVLENFHISSAFKIILDEDANILQNLSKEEYRSVVKLSAPLFIANSNI